MLDRPLAPRSIASVTPRQGAIYTALWAALCLAAAAHAVRSRARGLLPGSAYRSMLASPWRIATAIVGTAFFAVAAPYTGDPYWDRVVGVFMPLLTYATAPWSVGVLYRALRNRPEKSLAIVAVCAWLFSASWSYDLYNFVKFGEYPRTWLDNLAASSALYFSAGLFWNFTWREGRGAHLAFTDDPWPAPAPKGELRGAVLWVLLLGLVVLFVVVPGTFGWPRVFGR